MMYMQGKCVRDGWTTFYLVILINFHLGESNDLVSIRSVLKNDFVLWKKDYTAMTTGYSKERQWKQKSNPLFKTLKFRT
jgi:hypothetical protein